MEKFSNSPSWCTAASGVTKTKTHENEDLRPGLRFRTTKTKTPALSFRTTGCYHLPKKSGNFGWNVNGKIDFCLPERKFSRENGIS